MAPSKSRNRNSSSKKSKRKSSSNLSRSKKSSNTFQVKKIPKYLEFIRAHTKTTKKWYDVIVKNPKSSRKNLKKPWSSTPIECKNKCPETSCCIRIINLTRRITANCLHQIFSDFGTIKKLDLHFNLYDRASKGFSYIIFSNSDESENAVRTMNKCEIDGYEIICELWYLPYIEHCVSSILRGACSGVANERSPSRCVPPTFITKHSSELDGLSSQSGTLSHSQTSYGNLPKKESLSESSRRSYSRSPRQSRLRTCSKFSTMYRYKSKRNSHVSRSNSQSRWDSMCSKSSHFRSSKKSKNSKYSRSRY